MGDGAGDGETEPFLLSVSVPAPGVRELVVGVRSALDGSIRQAPMTRDDPSHTGWWSASVPASAGDRYWLMADGVGPLVDPSTNDLVMDHGQPFGVVRTAPWPVRPRLGYHHHHPVIYELHVRGFAHTFSGMIERLPYLADLGVQVIELMPVHPFDDGDNYWGYMPIVWGAIHRPYASGDDAPQELADLIEAAHRHGIEVWLDVVFNHTGEGDRHTWTFHGLGDDGVYRRDAVGALTNDTGCGNDINALSPVARHLIFQALHRFADLGIDGFRFDLASILTRDGGELVHRIGHWAAARGVSLVAEPWDLAAYQVGAGFADQRWSQWNDRFRDDVRRFLRGEAGMVPAMIERVSGSPDLFDGRAWRSLNYVASHDGLTLHDLTTVTDDRHLAWDCGDELRGQQICNAFSYLLMSSGAAMFQMGDEMGRSLGGLDNPYDLDGPTNWLDWGLLDRWPELRASVRTLIALRRLADPHHVRCFGVDGDVDTGYESRSLAWSSGALYVMANAWWEPLTFRTQVAGPWVLGHTTSEATTWSSDGTVVVAPRSVTVLVHEGALDDRRHPAQPSD